MSAGEERAIPLSAVETDWRRLDPRMLLVHPVQTAIQALPALIGALLIRRSQGSEGYWVEAAILAIVVGIGVLRYLTTRFRIHNGQIELRSGVFTKQVIATPADRVRTVDVTAPVFHRLLGLAKVEIGTAGAARHGLVLDALPMAEARRLREELIHHRSLTPAPPDGMSGATGGGSPEPLPPAETTLLTLDLGWVRFAPLTRTGLVSALALLALGFQWVQRYFQAGEIRNGLRNLTRQPMWVDVVALLGGLAVAVCVLAVVGYVLQFWQFRLTRHSGGTLHVARGLLTTRATSIEEKRIRGVEVGEQLLLRSAGGGRLGAITTGLSRREDDRGSALLVPPAPRETVLHVAAEVVGDREALAAPLRQHGPAARRRRYVRAVVPALVLAAGALWVVLAQEWTGWVAAAAAVVLVISPFLARDRYAGLGHYLSAVHLVVRSGSLTRRRDLLRRDGVIGFTIRETFFQRRAGLSSLSATTAAGRQHYTAYDIPRGEAVSLAHAVDPGLLGQFLAS